MITKATSYPLTMKKKQPKNTGLSIVYTSLVLTAGFILFCVSGFGGTKALGWLTSLTLLVATITNLVLLPVLLITFKKPSAADKLQKRISKPY